MCYVSGLNINLHLNDNHYGCSFLPIYTVHVGCYIYGATQNNQCDNDETLNSMIGETLV